MRNKTYFISDVHLGAVTHGDPMAREHLLVKWLEFIKEDAKALYLMGDIFDFWYEYKKVAPKGFTRFLGKLAELSDKGVEIHYFIGNHDLWVFDYLPNEIGLTLHTKPEIVEIWGKRFYLAHGDGLGDPSIKSKILKGIFHSKVCQVAFSAIHPRWGIGFGQVWSRSNRLKKLDTLPYLGENNEFQILWAKKQLEQTSVDYFIMGHRHLLLDLMLTKECRLIMLGEWLTMFSYAVFDGENLFLEQFLSENNF